MSAGWVAHVIQEFLYQSCMNRGSKGRVSLFGLHGVDGLWGMGFCGGLGQCGVVLCLCVL